MKIFEKAEHKNPWLFIPTLSFAQGLPMILVMQVTSIIFKSLGTSNEFIGLTTFLLLPMSFKFLMAPVVDMTFKKRKAVLIIQGILAIAFAIMAVIFMFSDNVVIPAVSMFALISIATSLGDLPIDGMYLIALNKNEQALFSGVKTAAIRVAVVIAGGTLVMIAGSVGDVSGRIETGWVLYFLILTVLFTISLFWHWAVMPYPANDVPVKFTNFFAEYFKTFIAFFKMRQIGLVLSFILLYRAGEGILAKMASPFFMDDIQAGGLGLSVNQVGFMYGTVGVVAMIIGGLLGGWLIKKFTLNKMIFPLALCMTLPNLLYMMIARYQPDIIWVINLPGEKQYIINLWAQTAIFFESVGYGMGYANFVVYFVYIAAKSKYKVSFYAIAAGLQTIGWMIPGAASGYIQSSYGYEKMFLMTVVIAVPGMICAYLIGKKQKFEN